MHIRCGADAHFIFILLNYKCSNAARYTKIMIFLALFLPLYHYCAFYITCKSFTYICFPAFLHIVHLIGIFRVDSKNKTHQILQLFLTL